MTFEGWEDELAKAVGAQIASEDGVCLVEVDDAPIVFRYLPESAELLTMGEVGAPAPGAEAPLASFMMSGNHLFVATGGATLSRNADTGAFFLSRRDPIDLLPFERWWAGFQSLVDSLARWRAVVADFRPPDAPTPLAEDSGSVGFMPV